MIKKNALALVSEAFFFERIILLGVNPASSNESGIL
jgi:hypothetical protein